MREFIITAIVVMAAAKAKAETEGDLPEQQNRLKSGNKRVISNKWTGCKKKSIPFSRMCEKWGKLSI